MNPAAAILIERPYQEVVDDILTAVVGGVVNEPIYFDVKETAYPLSQPASDVRTVVGTRLVLANGVTQPARYIFQKDFDYVFSPLDNSIAWQSGAAQPADETVFYVDYARKTSLSPLTDINVGSVTRTLSEAVAREMTTVYQQINLAYLSGFVDSATGQALDFVVSILDVQRRTAEFAAGLVTFFRDSAAGDGNIYLPAGTVLSTAKGDAFFETAEPRTLQRGQARVDVPVRATGKSKGPSGIAPAGAITTLAQAITGISRITNFDATILGAADETDDDLRARAKATMQGVGKATIAALMRVIFDEHAKFNEIRDPNSPLLTRSDAGTVSLLVDTPPERFINLSSAIQEVRAAGVYASVVARYVFFKPKLVATVAAGISSAGKVKLVQQIITAMLQYVDGLGSGTPAVAKELVKAITDAVKEISGSDKLQFRDVMAWRADVGNPSADPIVDALAGAVALTPAGDDAALRAALKAVVTETVVPPFSELRIPDRGLVQGPTGQRATDADIEAANFSVVATVAGDPNWTVALDSEPADIVLVEH